LASLIRNPPLEHFAKIAPFDTAGVGVHSGAYKAKWPKKTYGQSNAQEKVGKKGKSSERYLRGN